MSSSITPGGLPDRPDDRTERDRAGQTNHHPEPPAPLVAEPAPASARPLLPPLGHQGVPDYPGGESVAARQAERFGGVKVGSALFGWLTAAGIATLLTGLLTATGAAIGLANTADAGQAAADTAAQAQAGTVADTAKNIGIIGAVALLVILFVAYYCGGYVAGRMARFDGVLQGLAVWVWGLIIAAVIAIVAAVAGAKYDVLARLNLPRLPINEGTLTTGGIITVIAIALVTLAGALLGGRAGMHFHRKVDQIGQIGQTGYQRGGRISR